MEAVRLAANVGLRRGLRTAAAAAVAAAAAEGASSNAATSLEGRLLPAYLLAAPASSPPFLLRLMEQRFALGGGCNRDSSSGAATTTSGPPTPTTTSSAPTTTTAAAAATAAATTTTITLVTPHDVDAIFDALQARGCEDGDPYWARVWPSAVALAECLLARPELVRGKRVADVGAGLGVAGLAAALAGAREVALLDREPLALECARLSAEATALASRGGGGVGGGRGGSGAPPAFAVERPAPTGAARDSGGGGDKGNANAPVAVVDATGLRSLASVREVLGYDEEEEGGAGGGGAAAAAAATTATTTPTTTTTATTVRAAPFDWHERPLPAALRGRFDVVLACDVLYEQDAVAPLAEVLPLLLSDGGDGRVLLADPPARTAANRERFLELLATSKKGGAGGRRRFAIDEAALAQCAPRQLDRELLGGQGGDRPVPVQLLHLRAVDGNDTVGLLKAGGGRGGGGC